MAIGAFDAAHEVSYEGAALEGMKEAYAIFGEAKVREVGEKLGIGAQVGWQLRCQSMFCPKAIGIPFHNGDGFHEGDQGVVAHVSGTVDVVHGFAAKKDGVHVLGKGVVEGENAAMVMGEVLVEGSDYGIGGAEDVDGEGVGHVDAFLEDASITCITQAAVGHDLGYQVVVTAAVVGGVDCVWEVLDRKGGAVVLDLEATDAVGVNLSMESCGI